MKTLLIAALTLLSVCPLPQQVITARRRHAGGGGGCTLPFTDNFTASPGPLGAPWTTSTGSTIAIQSSPANTVGSGGGFTGGPQLAWPTGCAGWTTSHFVKGTLTITDTSHYGLSVQTQDQNNYYYIDCTTGGGCNLEKFIAGGPGSYVGTYSLNPASGNVVCLELDSGSTVKLKVNTTYDTSSFGVSGLSGTGGGGLWWGNQGTDGAYWGHVTTGNGTC